ncbi:MAG: hypothetical protein ABI581_11180, partial [Sediminibacterium sp.]
LDYLNGGLSGSPKFPLPSVFETLLQHHYLTGNQKSLDAVTVTLNKIANGGIYDQLAGGFSRYATDSVWNIPHFEKMLYDNGQMVSVYAHAYQLTRNDFYKSILIETLEFIEKTLAAPGGGYYSSLNADTKDGEGEFYAWNKKDFTRVAGDDKMIADYFHISQEGNWKPGSNILYANQTAAEFAIDKKANPAEFNSKLVNAKNSLVKERNKRTKPSVDTKIITAWNCIVLKGYADAYAATGMETYLEKAKSCAAFIEKNIAGNDGSLKRNFINGKAVINGFLDDYAWAVSAFIRLYEVSFDSHWLMLSKQIMDQSIKTFFNDKTGLFYYSEKQEAVVLRKTEVADDAVPSANAVMAQTLYTLGHVFNDTSYTGKGLKMYSSVSDRVQKIPRFHIQWCSFAALLSAKSYEVAIMGKEALARNQEIQRNYLPTSFIMGSTKEETIPLLRNKLVAGKTLIYVCTDKLCKRPEEITANAINQIK